MTSRPFERALVLAAHTDDGEFGCGATIAKLIEENVDVQYVAFSLCETSLPAGLPKDILKTELGNAAKVLGIPENRVTTFNYEVRRFGEKRQDILEDLVRINNAYSPDLVLMPSMNDIHQDHLVVAQEGLRAFKQRTILGYEVPWNNLVFNNSSFVLLKEHHVQKKIMAIREYHSQAQKAYASEDYIRSWAKTRGVQVGQDFAEVFEVIRWIIA